jgi:lactate permease
MGWLRRGCGCWWRRFFTRGRPARPSLAKVWRSWLQVAPVTALFIVLGVLMAVSGMAAQLAQALARSGPLYLLAAPFVGALGGFVTGSNTGANAMFAATQAEIAQALGAPLLPFMAVHNVSASLLLMASPGKVEMAVQLLAQGAAQRRWVQQSVLMLDLAAVALMGVLNWSWARA